MVEILKEVTNKLMHLGINVSSLKKINDGLESEIYIGYSFKQEKDVAIKIPKEIVFNNDNDQNLTAKSLYTQEYEIIKFLTKESFPVPKIYHFECLNEIPIIIMELITNENDFHEKDFEIIGKSVKKLHLITPPKIQLVSMEGYQNADELILYRLNKRFNVIKKIALLDYSLPPLSNLLSIMKNVQYKESLLHMDIRRENILKKNNKQFLFTDWSNSLIGNSAIELARIEEYGECTQFFIDGYGEISDINDLNKLIYRLDTAIMLTVVFLSEEPNLKKANIQLQKMNNIINKLKKEC